MCAKGAPGARAATGVEEGVRGGGRRPWRPQPDLLSPGRHFGPGGLDGR